MPMIIFKGKEVAIPEGSTIEDLANALHLTAPDQALAASVNGKDADFFSTLKQGDEVELWNFSDLKGKEVFWHTSAHILAQAVLRLFPEAKPTIGPPTENGFYYDFADLHIAEEDLERIEMEMEKIVNEGHRTEKETFPGKEAALKAFSHNKYKAELIESFEGAELTAYRQGEYYDLCRGPHLSQLKKVRAIKVLKTSGAYWRGDPSREMLTRIYAISFPDKKMLREYLHFLEEAKKRDHKVIGHRLDLFSHHEASPGIAFIHPKGMAIWNALLGFWRSCHEKAGYLEIQTPQLMARDLWELSGHWQNYRHNMYSTVVEEREFAIKPMNCPGCMLFYKSRGHSYREFPLRISEIGHVHRLESSGALSGLMRVRSFHQDDAHIFMEPHQIEEEILNVLTLVNAIYSVFGLDYHLELSTKPELGTIGTDEQWEMTTQALRNALDRCEKPYRVNEGEGAFYGPKIDMHIRDALGRTWQCGTIQLDMALPERFELEYIDAQGTRSRPIMIHRALFGSIERFLGILIEHFAGKFPLWLSPAQMRLVPVADRHIGYAKQLRERFLEENFHCDIDSSHESVSKKIRKAQLEQVNYMLTLGDQEMTHRTCSVRTRGNVVHGEMTVEALIKELKEERKLKLLHSRFEKE